MNWTLGDPVGACMQAATDKLAENASQNIYTIQAKVLTNQEKDPNGVDAKTPGAKLDAGKPPVGRGVLHYFPRALTAVACLSGAGASKYSWKGWESVPDGVNRYTDALARHELAIEGDFGRRDRDSGALEATAVAWNALARLELVLRENPDVVF